MRAVAAAIRSGSHCPHHGRILGLETKGETTRECFVRDAKDANKAPSNAMMAARGFSSQKLEAGAQPLDADDRAGASFGKKNSRPYRFQSDACGLELRPKRNS